MSARMRFVGPSLVAMRRTQEAAEAAERLEAVRGRRAELARLRRQLEEERQYRRRVELTLRAERGVAKVAAAERDARIAWLEARLGEYAAACRRGVG